MHCSTHSGRSLQKSRTRRQKIMPEFSLHGATDLKENEKKPFSAGKAKILVLPHLRILCSVLSTTRFPETVGASKGRPSAQRLNREDRHSAAGRMLISSPNCAPKGLHFVLSAPLYSIDNIGSGSHECSVNRRVVGSSPTSGAIQINKLANILASAF
jgi:hypothetical protein